MTKATETIITREGWWCGDGGDGGSGCLEGDHGLGGIEGWGGNG